MALLDINGLVKALATTQQVIPFYKPGVTTFGAGAFHSLWAVSGEPQAGSTSLGGSPSSATDGAMPLNNASIGKLYLARACFLAATPGYYLLYDRLAHRSGLVGNSSSSQSISLSVPTDRARLAAPNYGDGCRMFVEWYSSTGTGTPTMTVTYTNSSVAGLSGRTTSVVWPASPVAGQMLRIPLMAGDKGIRSVESVQLSAGTSVAGNWGITVINQLCDFSINTNNGSTIQDGIGTGLPIVENNACLSLLFMATNTTHGALSGQITLIDV